MKTLKHPLTSALVLLLILLSNTRHALYEYERITGDGPEMRIYNVLALLAIDMAVFLFALHGQKKFALGFTGAILLINLRHYLPIPEAWETAAQVFMAIPFALLYTVGIYMFSEIFKTTLEELPQRKRVITAAPKGKEGENSPGELPRVAQAQEKTSPSTLGELSREQLMNRRKYLRKKQRAGTLNGEAAELDQIEALLLS